MAVSWTAEQKQVIQVRDRNILVSAAAGSGKTAVLVERIIQRITDKKQPVDIDRLLVVTFTNAAAAEMRERIGAAIERTLSECPDNEHMQRQLTLIHNAQITTIDSFCLYVIRNHFHEIGLEPNFRIADEGELTLLKEDVIKQVLLTRYEEMSGTFAAFADGYMQGRSDAGLRQMILSLYEFSRSYPWPEEWLLSCVQGYRVKDAADLGGAVWMKPLIENIRAVLAGLSGQLWEAYRIATDSDGPEVYAELLETEAENYKKLSECDSYLSLYEAVTGMKSARLPACRNFSGDPAKRDRVKQLRDDAKEQVKKLVKQYFFCTPEVMTEQLNRTAPFAEELVGLTEEFAEAFAAEKRRKNIVDFHDLEHFALEILVDQETKQPKKTAEEFRDTFAEIMIDEYQDSNYVQETLLRAVSREERGEHNLFMVGDVKQSIYRFRLARPELFMEKYDTYSPDGGEEQRIDLHKNFRSREEVLSFVNDVFFRIMGRDLGNVEYDAKAALYPGASYPDAADPELFAPEFLLTDSADPLLPEDADKRQLEAKLVAQRIRRMMGEQLVTDKESGELRPVRYSDIVILLRSLSGWADTFAAVLNDDGIPAHTLSATGYFSAVEVQTVLALLRILDNPRQDIPLAAVLRSPIAGLTDEELSELRLTNPDASFCECVLDRCEQLTADAKPDASGDQKLLRFYRQYLSFRELVADTPIHELLVILLRETGYGNYAAAMPAGARRQANLNMLIGKAIAYEKTSYKGLYHFVRYIDELQKYEVDFGEADLTGENEDVVRIMSIHKSKGLEFPVVFVCGMGKQFNRQDVRSHMVLHPKLGLGLDCMDAARRLTTPTIAKRAVAKQIDLENLGEEMRVLYVAFTRAKEKLVLTGCGKELAERMEELRLSCGSGACPAEVTGQAEQNGGEVTGQAEQNGGEVTGQAAADRISYVRRESAAGYLDWLLPAILSYGTRYDVHVAKTAELVTEEVMRQTAGVADYADCMRKIRDVDDAEPARLEERFSFRYPYMDAFERRNKYSVSELKHRAMREKLEQEETELVPAFAREEVIPYIPPFVRRLEEEEEPVNRGAMRGTAMHRVMECYEFGSAASAAEQVRRMRESGTLSEELAELVRLPQIESFLASPAGARMRAAHQAGRLFREKPFVMGFTEQELERFGFGEMRSVGPHTLPLSENDGAESGDLTLIQGIIDVFWEEEDGIVVLDYKTDRVETAGQLKDRYAAQLALYGEALERLFASENGQRKRVKERLLYSFRLGELIPV